MKLSKLLEYVYIVLFILILFPGAETGGLPIFHYAAEMFVLMCIVYFFGIKYNRSLFIRIKSKRNSVWIFVMFLFLLYAFLTFSYYKAGTKTYVIRYFFFFVSSFFAINPNQIKKLYQIAVKYVLLVDIVFVLMYPILGNNGSFLGSYQNVATVTSIALLIRISDLFCNEKYTKREVFENLFLLLSLIMTGKRTFLVIPILVFMILFLFDRNKKKYNRTIVYLVFAIIGGLVILLIKPEILNSFARLLETSEDKSLNGRRYFWDLAINLFENNWLHGIGMGTYTNFINSNLDYVFAHFGIQRAYAPHNIYYQLLAETGVIGFTIWVAFFLVNLFQTISIMRKNVVRKNEVYKRVIYYAFSLQFWFIFYGFTGNVLSIVGQTYTFIFASSMSQTVKQLINSNDGE